MFTNLKGELSKKGITNKDLAELLGVDVKTIQNRLSGKCDWTLKEVIQITKFLFPEYRLEWLFATDAAQKGGDRGGQRYEISHKYDCVFEESTYSTQFYYWRHCGYYNKAFSQLIIAGNQSISLVHTPPKIAATNN